MLNKTTQLWILILVTLTLIYACGRQASIPIELKHYPLDNMDGIISTTNVELDKSISYDNNGSLKIPAPETTVVRLFEIQGIDIENARLIYQAKIRCENLTGYAFLEMWCHFPGKGDFFSRGLQNPITGTTNWITAETPFFLKQGEKPDIIRLNLSIAGKGTVWIDDIHLLKAPLN